MNQPPICPKADGELGPSRSHLRATWQGLSPYLAGSYVMVRLGSCVGAGAKAAEKFKYTHGSKRGPVQKKTGFARDKGSET